MVADVGEVEELGGAAGCGFVGGFGGEGVYFLDVFFGECCGVY